MIPVITIDGPSGSGKGTVAGRLALELGYHLLDSGAIYRVAGLAAAQAGVLPASGSDEASVLAVVNRTSIRFESVLQAGGETSTEIYLNDQPVSETIRTEEVGQYASLVGAMPGVRQALLAMQHDFAQLPGLVADGRDMGTVVFPGAATKIFLTASAEARAERRVKQLQKMGFDANLSTILTTIRERDARDMERTIAPLCPAADALIIDASALSVDEVMQAVLAHVKQCATNQTVLHRRP